MLDILFFQWNHSYGIEWKLLQNCFGESILSYLFIKSSQMLLFVAFIFVHSRFALRFHIHVHVRILPFRYYALILAHIPVVETCDKLDFWHISLVKRRSFMLLLISGNMKKSHGACLGIWRLGHRYIIVFGQKFTNMQRSVSFHV